jgi:DNA/RNA endonuclease YhcR with UshA esterase domain
MVRTHLSRIRLATVSLTCLAMAFVAGSRAAAAEEPAAKTVSSIPTAEAKAHIGETNTVCGLVTGGRFLDSSKGKPTFLNFERPYPDHTFTVVIFESDRAKFENPPETWFDGKTVCVTGAVIEYRGKPEIVVHDPSQIVIQGEGAASGGSSNQTVQSPTPAASKTISNLSQKLPASIKHP